MTFEREPRPLVRYIRDNNPDPRGKRRQAPDDLWLAFVCLGGVFTVAAAVLLLW